MGHKPRQPAKPTVTIEGEEFDRGELVRECEDLFEKMLEERLKDGVEGGDFATYEKTLIEIAHEVVRGKLEKKLQAMADAIPERVWIDHNEPDFPLDQDDTRILYRRHAPGAATYHSLVGPLRIWRATYRQCTRLRAGCVPLDLKAGLIERMTPAMAKSLAIGYAFMPPRQYEEFAVASGLLPPSRSTLDRAARNLGSHAADALDNIEPLVRANEIINPNARSIALGLDRTAVPMRSEAPSDLARSKGAFLSRVASDGRKTEKEPGSVQWRMDYVGTVSFLDETGKSLVSRKYRLPAGDDPQFIVERMLADVRHALAQRPLPIAVVQDGAPELWRTLTTALEDEPAVGRWTEVLDWYHLDERLSKCLDLCESTKTRESQRKRWHDALLSTNDGVRTVLRSLRRKSRNLDDEKADELGVHIRYFSHNRHRTNYADYKNRCLPIGSGITEGACKSVIGVRAKRSGQRWSQRGLTAALHLRSVHQSDRFNSFWSFFSQYYRARTVVATTGA